MQSEKQPNSLIRRILQSISDASLIPFLAILTALIVGGVIIKIVGGDPFLAYKGLIEGSLGSKKALSETAVWATPYIFAGLAVALAFKGGLFNIGAEGQLAVGAIFSALVGYALPEWLGFDLPAIIHLALGDYRWHVDGRDLGGLLSGVLKAYTGGHEVINTIMMNYIALNTTSFLLNGVMKDRSPTNVIARTPLIAESARIPPIFDGLARSLGICTGPAGCVPDLVAIK